MSIKPEYREFLTEHCNKMRNGTCMTRKCLLRGNGVYPNVDYTKSTCVAFEICKELENEPRSN